MKIFKRLAVMTLTGLMEIEYSPQAVKKYDADICAELGIEILEGYVAIEK